jgi:hypothetical protein
MYNLTGQIMDKLINIAKKFGVWIVRWFATTKIMSFPRKILAKAITSAILSKNELVAYHHTKYKTEVLDLIKKAREKTGMVLGDEEAYQIFMAVQRTEKIKGEIAEVGVYRGGSAKIICEAKGDRILHLFDTFEGLPQTEEIDILHFKGEFRASLEDVKGLLKEYPNVYFYKGLFPSTAEPVKNTKFSFVNLDVDIYRSTVDCLNFFYPRMNPGGIIISHDYMSVPGVRKAIDEFFKDKSEPVIELLSSQCLIVKV